MSAVVHLHGRFVAVTLGSAVLLSAGVILVGMLRGPRTHDPEGERR